MRSRKGFVGVLVLGVVLVVLITIGLFAIPVTLARAESFQGRSLYLTYVQNYEKDALRNSFYLPQFREDIKAIVANPDNSAAKQRIKDVFSQIYGETGFLLTIRSSENPRGVFIGNEHIEARLTTSVKLYRIWKPEDPIEITLLVT